MCCVNVYDLKGLYLWCKHMSNFCKTIFIQSNLPRYWLYLKSINVHSIKINCIYWILRNMWQPYMQMHMSMHRLYSFCYNLYCLFEWGLNLISWLHMFILTDSTRKWHGSILMCWNWCPSTCMVRWRALLPITTRMFLVSGSSFIATRRSSWKGIYVLPQHTAGCQW